MVYKAFDNVIMIRLHTGDELMQCLIDVCEKEQVDFGAIFGVGSTNDADLGVSNVGKGGFVHHYIDYQTEIACIAGNVSIKEGKPHLHVHLTISLMGGATISGHLFSAKVYSNAEIFLTKYAGGPLIRDAETGFLLEEYV